MLEICQKLPGWPPAGAGMRLLIRLAAASHLTVGAGDDRVSMFRTPECPLLVRRDKL